jgi:hypothetical protein
MDWIAGAIEFVGSIVVGNKNKWGFLINGIGCLAWVAYVLWTGLSRGLLLVVVPMAFVNLRNFIKWNADNRTVTSWPVG